jgi:hypothetical protein
MQEGALVSLNDDHLMRDHNVTIHRVQGILVPCLFIRGPIGISMDGEESFCVVRVVL